MSNFDNFASTEEQVEAQQYEDDDAAARYEVRVIKFLNGEEVICRIMYDDLFWTAKKLITIGCPKVVDRYGKFSEWITNTEDEAMEIATDQIRTIVQPSGKVITKYGDYLQDQLAATLRASLDDPDLSDEERDDIEMQLLDMYDGSTPSFDKEEPVALLYNGLPISNLVH